MASATITFTIRLGVDLADYAEFVGADSEEEALEIAEERLHDLVLGEWVDRIGEGDGVSLWETEVDASLDPATPASS